MHLTPTDPDYSSTTLRPDDLKRFIIARGGSVTVRARLSGMETFEKVEFTTSTEWVYASVSKGERFRYAHEVEVLTLK